MRTDLLGCSVDVLTMAETVELARVAMRDRRRLQHVALNVAKFVNMRSDRILYSDVMGSDVIGIDGMGIVLALRLFGVLGGPDRLCPRWLPPVSPRRDT
jgi:N-acetylglucosaminyldiphosphoundecaprenol N-acetyl-beta-D-mannosaminyltransferase